MKKLMMVTSLDTHLFPKPSRSLTQEDNKLKKPITSYLMKALMLIKFTKPSVDNIIFAESKRYPPDEYLHPYKPSQSETPMVPPNKLGPDLNSKAVNETQYRGMTGSLMYLTASRPNIQFSTCLCARYQANPKESHLIVVKRIFRCLSVARRQTCLLKCLKAEYVDVAGCYANILDDVPSSSVRRPPCWDLRFDDYKTTYEEKKKDETTRT
ncbi:hypothetical protein Tco_0079015 [Tanacetum coccineum]